MEDPVEEGIDLGRTCGPHEAHGSPRFHEPVTRDRLDLGPGISRRIKDRRGGNPTNPEIFTEGFFRDEVNRRVTRITNEPRAGHTLREGNPRG